MGPPPTEMRLITIFCALAIAGFLVPFVVSAQTPQIIRIEMREFAFRPATIHLRAGQPARLVLVTRGQIAHQFETSSLRAVGVHIVGEGMVVEAPGLDFLRLDPGGMARLDFFPRMKGRFVFVCTIEGHREAGMQGVLEVR